MTPGPEPKKGDPEWKDYRKQSRSNWGTEGKVGEGISLDQIRLGCDLRSADALEKIAENSLTNSNILSSIRWSLDEMNRRPTREKRELTRLKNLVKKQKAEIAQLRKGAS